MVERLFLAVPRGCLRFVIVVFPDHTHLLSLIEKAESLLLFWLFFVFCHFPMWSPGSRVVLECIDS